MNKEWILPNTGEVVNLKDCVVDYSKITPVAIVQVDKFDTTSNYTPRCDAEHNSGIYIIDDRDYCDLRTLLERCKRYDRRGFQAIQAGAMAQYDGMTEKEIESENAPSGAVPEDKSNNLSTGNEPTVESQGELNPVEKLPDENS